MNYVRLILCFAFALLLQFSVLALGVRAQNNLRSQVSDAVRLFPKDAKTSRNQLISFGDPAVPLIVEIIQSDTNLDPIKKSFLVDVIATLHGEKSSEALISLLADGDPYVRGLVASYVSKRKLQTAIPHLIALLEDKAVYKTVVQTDPSSEEPVLVRDVAIEALQATAGLVLSPGGTKDQQATAWKRWWKRRQSSKTR